MKNKNQKATPDLMRTALYIRVSTEEQAMHGYSLDAQEDALKKYAKSHGYKIAGIYRDEGFSASKPAKKRPAIQRLLSDVQAGNIDIILFTKIDRWFRSVREYYMTQTILDDNKVTWRSIMDDFDPTTADGTLRLNIMLSFAQSESAKLSERVITSNRYKVSIGQYPTTSVSTGFFVDENKRLQVDEEKAAFVRDIFNYYERKQSKSAVMRYVRDFWPESTMCERSLGRLLENRIYIGEYRGIKDFCPAIIPADQFQRVQEVLKSNNIKHPPSGRVYIFTGLLQCSECHSKLSAHCKHTSTGKPIVSYVCTHSVNKRAPVCHNSKYINERKLETYLLDHLGEAVNKYAADYESFQKAEKKKPKINKPKIKEKLSKLKELYVNDLIDMDEYKKDFELYQNQLAEAEAEETALRGPAAFDLSPLRELLASDFRGLYEGLTREEKRSFWRGCLHHVEIGADRIPHIFLC